MEERVFKAINKIHGIYKLYMKFALPNIHLNGFS